MAYGVSTVQNPSAVFSPVAAMFPFAADHSVGKGMADLGVHSAPAKTASADLSHYEGHHRTHRAHLVDSILPAGNRDMPQIVVAASNPVRGGPGVTLG